MNTTSIDRFENAISDVLQGMSCRQAAIHWGVPRSTLQDRIHGKPSIRESKEPNQRLSKAQEQHLCGWILTQDAAGNPPSHEQVRASTDAIQKFFKVLEIPAIKKILPTNRYNMDETGLAIGVRDNGLVLRSSAKRIALKKQSRIRSWTTIIECISATGFKTKPLVIFKGNSVQSQWFPLVMDSFRDWYFDATSRGWTNDDIALY
ncbi:hypothetical protein NLG97_g1267 [Lecanicillium saksenae]|uniref:Uncharacterized protein n=1 Tax=Lecanicillium saksenae TaxID=468837 RepID=A0ACC1R7I1_9HYPO|nr:hypothetical protein NLG97_g1267 [Lecanicillium saksenae]